MTRADEIYQLIERVQFAHYKTVDARGALGLMKDDDERRAMARVRLDEGYKEHQAALEALEKFMAGSSASPSEPSYTTYARVPVMTEAQCEEMERLRRENGALREEIEQLRHERENLVKRREDLQLAHHKTCQEMGALHSDALAAFGWIKKACPGAESLPAGARQLAEQVEKLKEEVFGLLDKHARIRELVRPGA